MEEKYLEKVLGGDINAFGYFVEKYKDMSFSIAMGIVKKEEIAEDIVQESFLKAFNNLKKFRKESKFSTWLYKIVVNECIQHTRKKFNHSLDYSDAHIEYEMDSSHDLFNQLNESEQKKYIQKTLAKLTEKESLLLKLYYLGEKNLNEIHEITGLSISNIKVILHRARISFHHYLQKELKHEVRSIL